MVCAPWRIRCIRKPRVVLFLRLPLVFLDGDVLKRIQTACEEFLFKGCSLRRSYFFRQTCLSRITLFVVAISVHSFLSSIMFSGYAWIRSDVITSWCLHRHTIAPGRLTRCCTPQSLHTVTLRMIPTYFLISVTLCCDKSRTRAMLFSIFTC